jgi:hypothetical protein
LGAALATRPVMTVPSSPKPEEYDQTEHPPGSVTPPPPGSPATPEQAPGTTTPPPPPPYTTPETPDDEEEEADEDEEETSQAEPEASPSPGGARPYRSSLTAPGTQTDNYVSGLMTGFAVARLSPHIAERLAAEIVGLVADTYRLDPGIVRARVDDSAHEIIDAALIDMQTERRAS